MHTALRRLVSGPIFFVTLLFSLQSCNRPGGTVAGTPNLHFGFTDTSGTRVIIWESAADSNPPKSLFALLPTGEAVPMDLVERRAKATSDQARDIAQDFDKLAGSIYKMRGGPIQSDTTVLLTGDDFLAGRQRLSVVHAGLTTMPDSLRLRIERARNIHVVHGWRLAELGSIASVSIIQCAPRNDTALACLVLDHNKTLFFEDFPGLLRGDSSSIWRVDDGGEFAPRTLRIIAAVLSSEGIGLARTWAGAEGENIEFLQARGGKLEKVTEAYRYWVPR